MNNNNTIFNGLGKIAGDALGAIGGLKVELEFFIQKQFEKYCQKMNFVSQEEFQVAQEMIAKLIIQQQDLKQEIDHLTKLIDKNE